MYDGYVEAGKVSTHSRLKAAGIFLTALLYCGRCFNTQPPEGGWEPCFNVGLRLSVSTHSRLKAAGTLSI